MKHSMRIMIIIFLVTSCRGYQEKFKNEHSFTREIDIQNQLLYEYRAQSTDSFGYMWYFQADSPFKYHRDSGIIANSGSFWLIENGRYKMQSNQTLAQKKREETTCKNVSENGRVRKINLSVYVYFLFIIVVIGFIVYCVRKRQQQFF